MIDYLKALLDKAYGLKPTDKNVFLGVFVRCQQTGLAYTTVTVTQLGREIGMRYDHTSDAIDRLVSRNILSRIVLPNQEKGIAINHPSEWVAPESGVFSPETRVSTTPESGVLAPETRVSTPETRVLSPETRLARNSGARNSGVPRSAALIPFPGSAGASGQTTPIPGEEEEDHDNLHGSSSSSGEVNGATEHAHAHMREGVSVFGEEVPGASETRPGASVPGEASPGGSSTRRWENEAFPGEFDWVLDSFKVKALSELEVGKGMAHLDTFRRWYAFDPEIRAKAYQAYLTMRAKKPIKRPVEYAVSIAVDILKNPEGRQHGQQPLFGPGGKPWSGPGRSGAPGPERDWGAEFAERDGAS